MAEADKEVNSLCGRTGVAEVTPVLLGSGRPANLERDADFPLIGKVNLNGDMLPAIDPPRSVHLGPAHQEQRAQPQRGFQPGRARWPMALSALTRVGARFALLRFPFQVKHPPAPLLLLFPRKHGAEAPTTFAGTLFKFKPFCFSFRRSAIRRSPAGPPSSAAPKARDCLHHPFAGWWRNRW